MSISVNLIRSIRTTSWYKHLFMPDDFDEAAEQAIYDWIAEHGQKKIRDDRYGGAAYR